MIEPVHSDRWVEQQVPVIYRTCMRYCGSADDAWEAFQETFLVFTRKRESLDPTGNTTAWLRETARRCSLSVARKRIQQTSEAAVRGITDSTDIPADTEHKELAATLCEELQRMNPEDRRLLTMVFVDGMTHREVAAQIKCPAGSLHNRVEKARGDLMQRMRRRGYAAGALLLLFLLNEMPPAIGGTVSYPKPPIAPTKTASERIKLVATSILLVIALALAVRSGASVIAANGTYPSTPGEPRLTEQARGYIEDVGMVVSAGNPEQLSGHSSSDTCDTE